MVGSRIADAEYVELSGVATVDPALWVDNGGRYLRLDWLEAMVMVRAWMDPEGRLRLARLRWEYGPGQREAEFERIRRQYGVAEELPTSQRTLVLAAMTRSRSRSGTSEPPGQLVRSIPTTPGGIESRWPNSSQSGSRFAAA